MTTTPFFALLPALLIAGTPPALAAAPYDGWSHSGSLFILTTPEGADMPVGSLVREFPLLVRLHRESFDFTQARPRGEDLRFATADGAPMAYQIEDWEPDRGEASVWLRVPEIKGQAQQEVRVFWGHPTVPGESSGAAVFNAANGYVSVWHLGEMVKDEAGTVVDSMDEGTTPVAGVIGTARRFAGRQGISGGEKVYGYPAGSSPHSSEAWVRADQANGRVLGWGHEEKQGKVVMQFRSPPHVAMDCYFSDANVTGKSRLSMGAWVHLVHTFERGDARLYVNGVLDAVSTSTGAPLDVKTPARVWLGGWYDQYDFIGALDEVRISRVVRPADWVRLQYENQKPMQTLVGPIVRTGDGFSVSAEALTVDEGQSVTVSAEAGGAQKIYWILRREGQESVVAVDRWTCRFDAGRVVGDSTASLQIRAIHAGGVKSKDITIRIREAIAEPEFTLNAPATWDGRSELVLTPSVGNPKEMQAPGAGGVRHTWSVSGPAVIKETGAGELRLQRAMGSGALTVTLGIDNGGAVITRSVALTVAEPAPEAWVQRVPAPDERPVHGQFYARDDRGFGTLVWNGILAESAASVFLRVFAGDERVFAQEQKPGVDGRYTFSAPLKAGLVKYRAEWGVGDTVLETATDLVCGDAFVINGQSNAVATDWGDAPAPPVDEWVRTFGATTGDPELARLRRWAPAVARGPDGVSEIGYWGLELGRRLVESQKVPIAILNGAVGGTRIDQHQRNDDDPVDVTTIYGRLLWRVREASLTHGIRGILWHQGENDQGADGPTGGFGWETYRAYFHTLAGSWHRDFPNLQHLSLFQIWPKACSMGVDGSDNRLREVQRTLPRDFSRLSVLSTLGIVPPGGCHYPAAGYAEFARLLAPLIERDHYAAAFADCVTPPNLLGARFGDGTRSSVVLEFDQPIVWAEALAGQFYLDGAEGGVGGGSVLGSTLTLQLKTPAPAAARSITYLDSASWSQDRLLLGTNGLAALTFCEVPIAE